MKGSVILHPVAQPCMKLVNPWLHSQKLVSSTVRRSCLSSRRTILAWRWTRRLSGAPQTYLPSRSTHSVMNNAFGSGDTRADVRAVVKWFNTAKGFGFVQPNDGSPDAFL